MISRLVILGLLVPALLQAQGTEATVQAADSAAAEGRHRDAIQLYEQVIEADPSLTSILRPRLALQYLWDDQPRRSAALLERHLADHPHDCHGRQHYALALSWADRLGEALAEYRRVQTRCPALRTEARMGEARVLLWRNEVREAESIYAHLLEVGTPDERIQARIGLANAALASYEPRRARQLFRELYAAGVRAPGVYEGLAQAAQESGLPAEALEVVDEAEAAGIQTGAMERVREEIAFSQRPSLRLGTRSFRDADGTARHFVEGVAELGSSGGASLEAALGRSRLSGTGVVEGWHLRAAGSHRPGADVSVTGSVATHRLEPEFQPLTADINVAWTPTDLRRVDISAARVTVLDNVAAIREGLTGIFLGLGLRQGITPWTAVSASADVTRWEAGNVRTRLRLSSDHRFSGVPMITAEWPTLYQTYSEPFGFAFFSPLRYWETGPAVDMYHRVQRVWHLNGYLRAGIQRETGRSWSPLGVARFSVERELRRRWGVRARLSWSNSNLATSTGFERTAATLVIARRF